jgi:hypothetical protein
MYKLLFTCTIAFIIGCSNEQNINHTVAQINQTQYIGHIISYDKEVTSSIIADSTKNQNYPKLMVDYCSTFHPFEYCENIAINNLQFFTSKLTADNAAVLLTKCGHNTYPINNDVSDKIENTSFSKTPYTFTTTTYTNSDSFHITINSIFPDKSISLNIGDKQYLIKSNDSLTVIDTLQARKDETFCYRQIIVTQTFRNFGINTLSDAAYLRYFMP